MRILFVAVPVAGHTLPLVPLAWAARAAGHEALFATGAEATVLVVGAGLAAVEVIGTDDLMSELTKHSPEAGISVRPVPPSYEDTNTLVNRKEWSSAHTFVDESQEEELSHPHTFFFGGIGQLTIDPIVRIARDWRADAVVYDPCMIVGLVSAKAVGIPAFCQGFGVWHPWALPAMPAMGESVQRYGLTDTVWNPVANIDVCPESIKSGCLDHSWPMRYVPYNNEAVLPAWLLEPPSRKPRVCVTIGTSISVYGHVEPFEIVIDALSTFDIDVIVLGAKDAFRKPLPENARAHGWLPLNAVLSSCSAIIHHGGAGTTFTALVAGVPQLVIPQFVDHPINAATVASRGVGIYLPERETDATSVRNGLFRLLDDTTIYQAATEVRDEIAAMPSPSEIIDQLTRATRIHR